MGPNGVVYALDVSPFAVERVRRLAAKRGLANLRTILSDCATGLPERSIDVALLYDILHMIPAEGKGVRSRAHVLAELRRVLAPGGLLSASDHHMHEEELVRAVTSEGLFVIGRQEADRGSRAGRGHRVLSFRAV